MKDVRGVLEIQVKHWSRAREAARKRLERWGWTKVRIFAPDNIGPRVPAPVVRGAPHVVNRKPWVSAKSSVLPARRPGRSSF